MTLRAMLLATTLVAAVAKQAAKTFSDWMSQFSRSYATVEEMRLRRSIFVANLALIEAHNAEADDGKHSYRLGLNAFADKTAAEFAAMISPQQPVMGQMGSSGSAPPASVDWEAKGDVLPVEDQGQLAQVFAFVYSNVVASWMAVSTGKPPVQLSKEQLVECSDQMSVAQYILDHGICAEGAYPRGSGQCADTRCTAEGKISRWVNVPANSEAALMNAVAVTPVAVFVEADQAAFQFYTSGVLTASCGSQLDHMLLVTGYGTTTTAPIQDYYRAQNTWGESWGEAGYVRLGRGAAFPGPGQCGIQSMPFYPQ